MIDYGTMELFPTPIYIALDPNFNEYKDDVLKYIEAYKEEYDTMEVSNISGYQSSSDIHQDPKFKDICNIIWNTVIIPGCDVMSSKFMENGYPGTKFSLHNIWFNSNPHGSWNMPHTHPHCFYSGVYWIQTPESCGDLVLHSPHSHSLYGLEHNIWNVPPEEGRVVLFPANMQHHVNSNLSTDDRISLSFNIAIDIP